MFDFLAETLSQIFQTDRRIREESRLGESRFSIRDKKIIAILFCVLVIVVAVASIWLNLE